MNTIIFFSILFLLLTVRVRSELKPNIEHFVMTEAHIEQYRTTEDKNTGYAPYYMKCSSSTPLTKHSCQTAIPQLNDVEGNVTIRGSNVYYGCPQKIDLEKIFNPQNHFQNALVLKRAQISEKLNLAAQFFSYANVYQHRCTSKVSPILWTIRHITGRQILYGIGFLVPGLETEPIAEVTYDHHKNIPIWTKHTLHGISLAAPKSPFNSIELIVYQDDSEESESTVKGLSKVIKSYYQFNERDNDKGLLSGWYKIPQTIKIVLGHLIPEYDMITTNWQNIPRFAQTIVPTWEDLYLSEWIDVEEKIREVSFTRGKQLTVFSGTHGQLTFDITTKETQDKPKFYLGDKLVSVPEMFWKLVIDENSYRKNATVIIFRNVTKQLEEMNVFTKFEPPCNSICNEIQQNIEKRNQPIYCCKISDVKNEIEELPTDVLTESYYEILIK